MLRIIGRTIEHVIGRSSEQLEGVETEAKMVISSEDAVKSSKEDDKRHVYMLDIIDASGFLHKGSALSHTFQLLEGASTLYDPLNWPAHPNVPSSPVTVSRNATEITATVLKLDAECVRCGKAFTFWLLGTRRHHCRSCWRAFCADCSSKRAMVRFASHMFILWSC
jgi:hypothetical protein